MRNYLLLICFVSCSLSAQSWQWAHSGTVAHSTQSSMANAVVSDAGGNVYVAGSFNSQSVTFGTFTLNNSGTSGQDFYVVMYGTNGSVLWAKSFGGQADDVANGIAIDNQSNIYVTGTFDSPSLLLGANTYTSAGGQDFYILKLDLNGNVIWARTSGGSGNDISNAVCVDQQGNVLITGDFNSPFLPFSTGNLVDTTSLTQPFVVKYDTSGQVRWARTATGTGGSNGSFGSAISTDTASNVFVSGGFGFSSITFGNQSMLNNGITNMFIAKYDSTGTLSWVQRAGGPNEDAATGVATDRAGNVYLCGSFNSPQIIFGSTVLHNQGFSDIFLAKYSPGGNPLWAYSSGGAGIDQANGLGVDPNGFAYVCGSFGSQSISFNTYVLNNNGNLNIFLAEFHPAGYPLWAKATGGSASDYALSASAGISGNACIAGYFNSASVPFGPSTLIATGSSNMLVAKVSGITGIETSGILSDEIVAYPNPAFDNLYFRLPPESTLPHTITLHNSLGQEVYCTHFPAGVLPKLSVSSLPPGIYFYSVLDDNKHFLGRGKVLIQ
jgi:hypothetical protein